MNAYTDPLLDPRLRPYLKDVQAWHGYVRFLGLPTLQDHPDTPLHELFVQPLLSQYSVSSDSPTANWPKGEPVLATLHVAKRLVVLGDPGSGKSVLINWLAWLLVSGVEERIPDWLHGCIPLPLVLREMDLGGVKTFDNLLDAFLKRPVAAHLRGQKDLLLELLKAGKVLVLADGLDEVGSGQRESLRNALWDGFEQYSESYFLATSRIVGYEDYPVDKEELGYGERETVYTLLLPSITKLYGPTSRFMQPRRDNEGHLFNYGKIRADLYYILGFDDDRIRAFAVNWYRLRSLKPTADSDAEQFIKALFRDETTRRLARNPQLLTLMALVYRVRAHLPDGRAMLYDLIAEAYLESIDKARNITTSAVDAAPWREKRRWLARVGFEMQYRRMGATTSADEEVKTDAVSKTASVFGVQGRGEDEKELLATRKEVLGWLAEAMHDSGYSANPGFVDSYLHWVARRSGLLLPRGEELFAFVHLSFQEYFAALYLCEYLADADWVLAQRDLTTWDGDWRVDPLSLLSWAKDHRWQETLVFCFETFAYQPKNAKRLASWLFGDAYWHFLKQLKPNKNYPNQPEEAPRAELLVRLLTNPHSGLNDTDREVAFSALMQYFEQAELRFGSSSAGCRSEVFNRLLIGTNWAERFWSYLIKRNPIGLNLMGVEPIDINRLQKFTQLQELNLSFCSISDLSPLIKLTRLRQLIIDRTFITDLSQISLLTGLQELGLCGNYAVDLSPLAQLHNLEWLGLSVSPIEDITPLSSIVSLKQLFIDHTAISDLSPLIHLPNLELLDIRGVKAPIPPALRQREGLQIIGP